MCRALERAAHLVGRIPRRAAHLPGELLGDLCAALLELVAELEQQLRALRQRHVTPRHLRVPRGAQHLVDLLGRGQHALDVDAPVHRAHGFLGFRCPCDDGHQMISK